MDTTLYLSKPGIMSCAGNDINELWQAVTNCKQDNIQKVTACNGKDFFAARISDSILKPSDSRFDMKIIRIENAALEQIATDITAVTEKYGAERIAVCVGSCDNGTEFSLAGHRKYFSEGQFPSNYSLEIQGADYVATFIAEKFGLKGPVNTFSTACSSSAGAIIKAAEMLIGGIADAAIVGGIDIASDTTLIGFDSLEAVSSEITNPFSKNRHGITLGDGAAFFVLSKEPINNSESKALKLLGWGESADAYHMTSPDPSGAGAKKAIQRALDHAGIEPSDVGYINLHGTGTKFNDSMESIAVDSIFSSAGIKVPVSTTKPVTGHTLGAAAALELAICWKTLIENNQNTDDNNSTLKFPLQIWDGQFDEELPKLNFVDKNSQTIKGKLKICLSNSFAFGGANACLVLGI